MITNIKENIINVFIERNGQMVQHVNSSVEIHFKTSSIRWMKCGELQSFITLDLTGVQQHQNQVGLAIHKYWKQRITTTFYGQTPNILCSLIVKERHINKNEI